MLTEVRKKIFYKKNYNLVKMSETTTFRVLTVWTVVTEKIIMTELTYNLKQKSLAICLIMFHPSNIVQPV